ncbi:melanoma-associated antigen B5 [Pteropus vampyrus]|uniref:Melanoma-associated antigen B5 n=1 Tax=Pteropus vampyrus TaxID=132908 RepID=A0A6P3RQI6_PTEVA|nr:melanoma-associated antigen B5 [Pteropus vampyrus]
MPRSHKSKHQAYEKRCRARGETQGEGAKATAVAEEESTSSSSPQCEGNTQSQPAAELCSTSQGPQSTPVTTIAVISCPGSDEASNSQDEDTAEASEALPSTESSDIDNLAKIVVFLERFLLYKYKMKQRTLKEEMLRLVGIYYQDRFPEILKKASEHIEAVFALDVREVDSTRQLYDLVSKLKLPNNGRVRAGRGLPKTGLLMNILGMIFIKGNRATEEEIWRLLGLMRVYAGRKHFIYGEPKKLITKDLVRLKYLEYRQVTGSDPPRYEFLWGPKAHLETSKMKVLQFLAKVNDTVPTAFPICYKEALQDEEERTRATGCSKGCHYC